MFSYFKSVISLDAYYNSMQQAFINLFGGAQMLHYPLYEKSGQTLLQGQEYLSTYCIDKLGSIENKILIDIGCGNGVQSLFILEKYKPKHLIGIELNAQNIKIAQSNIVARESTSVSFIKDNAETLKHIADSSTDLVICIESAFHYRNKHAFLKQISRILKPGGTFLIADLILKPQKKVNAWEKKVKFNNWNEAQYEQGFFNARLQVNCKEDLTPKVIMAFIDSKNWFSNKEKSHNLSWFFSIAFAKSILKLYIYQLKTRHNYMLYIGISKS